jgi:maleylpyruvate isomerase
MPAPMLAVLLTDVAASMGEKPDCPALRLTAPDGSVWEIGDPGAATTVTGPASGLAAWLLGRSKGRDLRSSGGRKLPALPRWL